MRSKSMGQIWFSIPKSHHWVDILWWPGESGGVKWFFVLAILLFVAACSLKGKKEWSPLDKVEPVSLRLKGQAKQSDLTQYQSQSKIFYYENGQLVREKLEAVDFSVLFEVQNVIGDFIHAEIEVKSKDGLVDLHELGFPELNERVPYVIRSDGLVYLAGAYPKDSIFYVPPISLPETKVTPGDTWSIDVHWRSQPNNIPLQLELVTILKEVTRCFENEKCALLEMSGSVSVVGLPMTEIRINSTVHGYALFSINRGAILWSEMRSQENVVTTMSRMEVHSCMVSQIKEPRSWQWPMSIKVACDPMQTGPIKVPGRN